MAKRTVSTSKESTLRPLKSAPGKPATVAPSKGYPSCVVLVPTDVNTKGGVEFSVALRINAAAGSVRFTPPGKETLVIDTRKSSISASALQKIVREQWLKKGGAPTTVRD